MGAGAGEGAGEGGGDGAGEGAGPGAGDGDGAPPGEGLGAGAGDGPGAGTEPAPPSGVVARSCEPPPPPPQATRLIINAIAVSARAREFAHLRVTFKSLFISIFRNSPGGIDGADRLALQHGRFRLESCRRKPLASCHAASRDGLQILRQPSQRRQGERVAMCAFICHSAEAFQAAMKEHGAEIMADIANYTDIAPVLQVSEVVIERSDR